MGNGAGWSDAGVIIPWTAWLQTGDTSVLEENWNAMETYLNAFDAANPDASAEKRFVSTVAPQALFLLNHDFVLARARQLAARLAREASGDETARIQRAYALLFARQASAEEIGICREFLARAGKSGADTAWQDLAHVLLCSNEFVYVD